MKLAYVNTRKYSTEAPSCFFRLMYLYNAGIGQLIGRSNPSILMFLLLSVPASCLPTWGLCVCVCFGLPISVASSSERKVLRMLYAATQGPGWVEQAGWETNDPDLSTWHGIVCDEGGHVTMLQLPSNNLRGEKIMCTGGDTRGENGV